LAFAVIVLIGLGGFAAVATELFETRIELAIYSAVAIIWAGLVFLMNGDEYNDEFRETGEPGTLALVISIVITAIPVGIMFVWLFVAPTPHVVDDSLHGSRWVNEPAFPIFPTVLVIGPIALGATWFVVEVVNLLLKSVGRAMHLFKRG
jgi:hypothetical protein